MFTWTYQSLTKHGKQKEKYGEPFNCKETKFIEAPRPKKCGIEKVEKVGERRGVYSSEHGFVSMSYQPKPAKKDQHHGAPN